MTVAARIEIQVAGHAEPGRGQVQDKPPGAESFRSKWQEQLDSLSGRSGGPSGDLETGEEPTERIASGDPDGAMPGSSLPMKPGSSLSFLSLPLKLSGVQQGARALPTGGTLNSGRNVNGAVGTGAPGARQTFAKGLDAASPRIEIRRPDESSSPARTARSGETQALVTAKSRRPSPGDGANSIAATAMSFVTPTVTQVPVSE